MDGYRIVKLVGNVEEDFGHVPGDRAQVLAKLKAAVSWVEPQQDGGVIIAGEVYFLRPSYLLITKEHIQHRFGVAEPTHVA